MASSNPQLKTDVSCSNPECSHRITITVDQKRELLTENFLKYGKISLIYCSKACQEAHQAKLAESKFLKRGALKNHEYALIVNGADVTKRPKEKEVHIITGNVRELRAKALRAKLISVIPRKKRKYLTSREVQEFLLNDVSANLKTTVAGAALAAWRTMNKCEELFPLEISIFEINEKDRCIEYIKQIL